MKKIYFFIILILINFNLLNSKESFNRIISISPALTETIYLLESEDKLIANTTYCIRPENAEYKEKIGNITDINIEKIIVLKPDLILATTMTRYEKIQQLIKLGYKVEIFYEPKNYNEVCGHFKRISILLNKEKKADEIIKNSNSFINEITQKIKNQNKYKVFIQIGKDPLFTVSKNSFINDYIELSGGINIAKDAINGLYNRESVIKSNPDIIIITEMGIQAGEEIIVWKKFKSINAVKNNRIYVIDEYLVCSPNPLTFCSGLKEFIKIIHPELKIN